MKNTIFLTIFAVCFLPLLAQANDLNSLPVLKFQFKAMPANEQIEPIIQPYHSYIQNGSGMIPPDNCHNDKATPPIFSTPPLYNNLPSSGEVIPDDLPQCHYSLDNSRFVEAMLAKGYHLQCYMTTIGDRQLPISGVELTITGYDRQAQIFTGKLSDGNTSRFSYDYVKRNLRYAELIGESAVKRNWEFSFVRETPGVPQFKQPDSLIVAGNSLGQAMLQACDILQDDNSGKLTWMANLSPEVSTHDLLTFYFEIKMYKYKNGEHDKLGYVRYIPNQYKSGYNSLLIHKITIDKLRCYNYIGDQYDRCGGSVSFYVLPVTVSVNFYPQTGVLYYYLSRYSLCNVKRFSLPPNNIAPTIIRGKMFASQ